MEFVDGELRIDIFLSVTLGIVALFVGKRLNEHFAVLREYSIPEPVSGGLLFSVVFALLYATTGISVEFNLGARDFLLVYFFTTIGINASFADLKAGGKPLIILSLITVAFLFAQNLTGLAAAAAMGQDLSVGLLGGSVSLMGGYGTAIAWSPRFAELRGVENAAEIAIACATFGLIIASTMGGPIARYLIEKHKLQSSGDAPVDVGARLDEPRSPIDATDMLDSMLAIHISIIVGATLHGVLVSLNFELPLFVACLLAGLLITNLLPDSLPRLSGRVWPDRTPAMNLIAEISLGAFLAMSLVSLQLWKLIDLAGPLLVIMLLQTLIAVLAAIFVVFPLLRRNYDAAVICAGFGGIALGSTPTAMANMAAVTQKFGASHLAFIVVPLVCAFFLDLANALVIPLFLSLL